MIAHRIVAALRLRGFTVPELSVVLAAADSTIRNAVAELASRGTVRPTWRVVQGRNGGPPARVWELQA